MFFCLGSLILIHIISKEYKPFNSIFKTHITEIDIVGHKGQGVTQQVYTQNEAEPEQTAEERKAKEYRCNITRMIHDIENLDVIKSIYSFIMGMLSAEKGSDTDEQN